MKPTVILSAIILTLALAIGFLDGRKLPALMAEERRLAAEAASMGISQDGRTTAGTSFKSSVRKDAAVTDPISDKQIHALLSAMTGLQPGSQPGPAQKLMMLQFMNRVMAMSGSEIEGLVGRIQGMPDLEPKETSTLLRLILGVTSSKHPEATLRALIRLPQAEADDDLGREVMKNAMMAWAEKDPDAALAWFRKNQAGHERWITDKTKMALVKGAARKDPAEGFRIAAEVDPGAGEITRTMAMVVKTDDERSAMLKAMRARLDQMPAGEARTGLENYFSINLAVGALRGGFGPATEWLEQAAYSDEQLDGVVNVSGRIVKAEEAGKWAEWIGKNVRSDRGMQGVSDMFGRWAVQDRNAASSWLQAAPADGVRDAAVAGFAGAVSKNDPGAAEEWALTISSGQVRQRALVRIHENLPKAAPEEISAAAEFARRHGIEGSGN